MTAPRRRRTGHGGAETRSKASQRVQAMTLAELDFERSTRRDEEHEDTYSCRALRVFVLYFRRSLRSRSVPLASSHSPVSLCLHGSSVTLSLWNWRWGTNLRPRDCSPTSTYGPRRHGDTEEIISGRLKARIAVGSRCRGIPARRHEAHEEKQGISSCPSFLRVAFRKQRLMTRRGQSMFPEHSPCLCVSVARP